DNGEDALRAVEAFKPDLTLMDIEIRGQMNGLEVAGQFRTRHDIPVIFLTGRSDDETLERVRCSESFGYLLKPFRPEELKAGIELALIRHRHESNLKRIELSLSAAIQSSGDAILITDKDGAVTYLNPAAERLTGCPARKAVGRKVESVFRIGGDEGAAQRLLNSAAKGAFVHDAILITAAGREVPVEVNVSTIQNARRTPAGLVLVFRNITERKRFEAELKKSQAELRLLAGHIESAREAERTRIAREIHDEFGQLLTAFKFDISWLEKKLSSDGKTPRKVLVEKTRSMRRSLSSMVQSVRRISAELRPGVLDDLGLAAAVEWQTEEFQKRTGIKAKTKIMLSDREPPQVVATALFRVFQEALTNVGRHSNASSVRVCLLEESGRLTLEVSDNGRGITQEEMNRAGAFGLMGMRERITPLRGVFEICGRPGEGVTVTATVPLDAPKPDTEAA
ncbi:MAG TPA: PAS domain S-box protein, partial [Verrucomicrobiota bacterium]|nr:PAS domain S-box protein [Verrucomicrobiota bacterium]